MKIVKLLESDRAVSHSIYVNVEGLKKYQISYNTNQYGKLWNHCKVYALLGLDVLIIVCCLKLSNLTTTKTL